jgi:hypothetical protein
MREYIAFDSHKRYTWVEHESVRSGKVRQYRVEHAPGAIRRALAGCEPGTEVALEATANWYWIVDEIEQARLIPKLVHPRKAKLMMGLINKTATLAKYGMPATEYSDAYGPGARAADTGRRGPLRPASEAGPLRIDEPALSVSRGEIGRQNHARPLIVSLGVWVGAV